MVEYDKCRTCGDNKYSEECVVLHATHHRDCNDIKSAIIFCIPQMAEKLSRDDKICKECLMELDIAYKFIQKCLKAQDRLNEIHKWELHEDKIEIVDIKVEEEESSNNSSNPAITSVGDLLENNEENTLHHIESEKNSVDKSVSRGSSRNISLIPLTCSVCSETFKSMRKYKEHKKEHITERDYLESCTQCKLKFYESKDFEQHFQVHHPDTNLHKCEKCGACFLKSITYKKHRQKYSSTKSCRFECERCNKVFLIKGPYIKHLSMAERTSSCEFKRCSICCMRFTKKDFNEHCKIHQNAFICEQCGKSFATKSRLYYHKQCHNDPNTCLCTYCGKGCKSRSHLRSHLKSHAERPNKEQLSIEETHKFACDLCPKRFNKKYRFESHRKQHLNIRDYSCDQCDKAFCTRVALTTHQRLSHLGIKPFSCNVCGKKFGRKDYLRDHVILHTGEPRLNRKKQLVKPLKILDSDGMANNYKKPGSLYICKVCKKSFKMLSLLKVHYQAHINLRTHKCQFCELSFVNRSSVAKHEKLHKDPTYKFRCNICFKRKTSEEELTKHMAIHTKRPYKCSVCSETFARQYLMENHITNTHSEEVEEKSRELLDALNIVATGS